MPENKVQTLIQDNRKKLVDKIVEDMQQEELNWITPFLKTASPSNPITGTTYQGINRLHLTIIGMMQGYTDNRWCTFNQIKKQEGWKLKKGAKSAIIEHWKNFTLTKEDEETGENIITAQFLRPVGYWRVFNASDIEGIPPSIEQHITDPTQTIAQTLIQSSRCPIITGQLTHGYGGYAPIEDKIIMAPQNQYISDETYTRTLLHEMTHSTGHSSALNRDVLNTFGTPKYAFEELIAELGALFTAADLGIQTTTYDDAFYKSHIAYLQSWITTLNKDTNYLFQAAAQAEKATTYIQQRYQETLDHHQAKEQEKPSLGDVAQESRQAAHQLTADAPIVEAKQER